MTKEEKRALFCELLAARPWGDAAAKLAKWVHGSASTVYKWKIPGGPWPADEDKEARMWAFFGYALDARGNPIPAPATSEPVTGLLTISESAPMPVTVRAQKGEIHVASPQKIMTAPTAQDVRDGLERIALLTTLMRQGLTEIAALRKSIEGMQKEARKKKA